MSTIPASLFVNVVPSVLPAGGAALDVNCVVMTESTRVPIGSVYSFGSASAVEDFFGSSSAEAIIAGGGTNLGGGYFAGFTNSDALPGSLLFAQYPKAAVQAYLQSGDVGAALTVAELQTITAGVLTVTVDGVVRTTSSLDLSGDASFSAMATTIETALNAALATIANLTGIIAGTTLTASAVTGVIAPGQSILGAGVDAGLYIVEQLTGSAGGAGTYRLSGSDTVGSEAMTTKAFNVDASYDSLSGSFLIKSGVAGAFSTIGFATGNAAATLLLTAATGAVTSQGSDALAPGEAMDLVIAQTTNWVTYLNATDPDAGSGNALKLAFAAWKNTYPNRYGYICMDPDVLARSSPPQVTTLGALLEANGDSGTFLLSELTDLNQAAFVAGAAASIDFEEVAGRITFAFKGQAGLTSDVTSGQTAINLGGNPQVADDFGNGYNYYGAVGSAAANFLWLQRGIVTGSFRWFDSYINQVVMNNTFQGALLNLQSNAKSIPYTVSGDNLIETALADPIAQFLAFGAFAPGDITNAQKVAVNNAAGADVANSLQTQGYYLQVLPASGTQRASRTSPPAKFWYLDRGSVQAITLDSIALQ